MLARDHVSTRIYHLDEDAMYRFPSLRTIWQLLQTQITQAPAFVYVHCSLFGLEEIYTAQSCVTGCSWCMNTHEG
jgi:hypothetical protein